MGKKRQPKKTKPKARKKAKKTCVKMKLLGLPIGIPPELDLPAGAPFEGRDRPATMEIPKDIQELLGPLGEMATNAWRLKVRMVDSTTGEPKEETRKLYRFVEGLFRALNDAGIQVIDKTGRPYDSGMPEKVISYEQTPGLAKEEIIDTVRPSIRWKERALFNGEIIVGIPVIEHPADEASPTETDSAPAGVITELIQPVGAMEAASPVSGDAPDPPQKQSVDVPEPDGATPETQPVAAQADPGLTRSETILSDESDRREVRCDDAGEEVIPASTEDTQEPPAALENPEQSEVLEPRKE